MSNERKPLLSDDAMYIGVPMDQARPDGTFVPGITRFPLLSAGKVRDFYENLITSGKLRVVEEVYAEPNDLDDYYFPLRCSKCKVGFAAMEAQKIFEDEPLSEDNQMAVMRRVDFCPGCGNPIKKNAR